MKKSLALVGVGNWGKNLARNFYQMGALHTLCDTNETWLNQYKQQMPEISIRTDFKSILQNPEISQIAIATPPIHHYCLAKQALMAGKDVYVEKPLTLNFSDCAELHQISHGSKLILMAGHILHYHPSVICLKKMIQKGELGEIRYISSNRFNIGNIQREENVLWDLGPHDVSLILSLIDQPLESLSCVGNACALPGKEDIVNLRLKFAKNIYAKIQLSRIHSFKEQKMIVVGSQGIVVFDDTKSWSEKLLYYQDRNFAKQGHLSFIKKKINPIAVNHPIYEPLNEECAHFLSCCEKRIKPQTDGEESARVIQVIEDAQESLNKIRGPLTLTCSGIN